MRLRHFRIYHCRPISISAYLHLGAFCTNAANVGTILQANIHLPAGHKFLAAIYFVRKNATVPLYYRTQQTLGSCPPPNPSSLSRLVLCPHCPPLQHLARERDEVAITFYQHCLFRMFSLFSHKHRHRLKIEKCLS